MATATPAEAAEFANVMQALKRDQPQLTEREREAIATQRVFTPIKTEISSTSPPIKQGLLQPPPPAIKQEAVPLATVQQMSSGKLIANTLEQTTTLQREFEQQRQLYPEWPVEEATALALENLYPSEKGYRWAATDYTTTEGKTFATKYERLPIIEEIIRPSEERAPEPGVRKLAKTVRAAAYLDEAEKKANNLQQLSKTVQTETVQLKQEQAKTISDAEAAGKVLEVMNTRVDTQVEAAKLASELGAFMQKYFTGLLQGVESRKTLETLRANMQKKNEAAQVARDKRIAEIKTEIEELQKQQAANAEKERLIAMEMENERKQLSWTERQRLTAEKNKLDLQATVEHQKNLAKILEKLDEAEKKANVDYEEFDRKNKHLQTELNEFERKVATASNAANTANERAVAAESMVAQQKAMVTQIQADFAKSQAAERQLQLRLQERAAEVERQQQQIKHLEEVHLEAERQKAQAEEDTKRLRAAYEQVTSPTATTAEVIMTDPKVAEAQKEAEITNLANQRVQQLKMQFEVTLDEQKVTMAAQSLRLQEQIETVSQLKEQLAKNMSPNAVPPAAVNLMTAETNRLQSQLNARDAEVQRLNAQLAAMRAEIDRQVKATPGVREATKSTLSAHAQETINTGAFAAVGAAAAVNQADSVNNVASQFVGIAGSASGGGGPPYPGGGGSFVERPARAKRKISEQTDNMQQPEAQAAPAAPAPALPPPSTTTAAPAAPKTSLFIPAFVPAPGAPPPPPPSAGTTTIPAADPWAEWVPPSWIAGGAPPPPPPGGSSTTTAVGGLPRFYFGPGAAVHAAARQEPSTWLRAQARAEESKRVREEMIGARRVVIEAETDVARAERVRKLVSDIASGVQVPASVLASVVAPVTTLAQSVTPSGVRKKVDRTDGRKPVTRCYDPCEDTFKIFYCRRNPITGQLKRCCRRQKNPPRKMPKSGRFTCPGKPSCCTPCTSSCQ